jgi:hypothetical protein
MPRLAPRRTCWPRTAIGRASVRGYLTREAHDRRFVVRIVQEQQELVAAKASDAHHGSPTRSRSRRRPRSDFIASFVARGVVDVLEAIEIEQDQRGHSDRTGFPGDHVPECVRSPASDWAVPVSGS